MIQRRSMATSGIKFAMKDIKQGNASLKIGKIIGLGWMTWLNFPVFMIKFNASIDQPSMAGQPAQHAKQKQQR